MKLRHKKEIISSENSNTKNYHFSRLNLIFVYHADRILLFQLISNFFFFSIHAFDVILTCFIEGLGPFPPSFGCYFLIILI